MNELGCPDGIIIVVAGRDYGDGYPDGIIISEIYGKLSVLDAEDIQKMLNVPDYGLDMLPDMINMSTEHQCNTVDVKCEVWWEHDNQMWEFDVKEYIVDGITYSTIEEYTAAQTVLWNEMVRRNTPRIPFLMMGDKATKVELNDSAEVEMHEYKGIEFITHRHVFGGELGKSFTASELLSGRTISTIRYAPDRIRAIADFHNEVDRIGVLGIYARVSKTLTEIHDTYPISLDEWFAGDHK